MYTTVLAQLEVISTQLIATFIVQANISQVQRMRCDFCGQGHANGNYVLEGYIEESYYAGNFQKEVTLILILIMQVRIITQTSIGVTTKELLKPFKLLKHNNKGSHLNLEKL